MHSSWTPFCLAEAGSPPQSARCRVSVNVTLTNIPWSEAAGDQFLLLFHPFPWVASCLVTDSLKVSAGSQVFCSLENASSPAVRDHSRVCGIWDSSDFPPPRALHICSFIQQICIEPQNCLALWWAPGTKQWTRPKVSPHAIHGELKKKCNKVGYVLQEIMGWVCGSSPSLEWVFRKGFLEGVACETWRTSWCSLGREERRKTLCKESWEGQKELGALGKAR